MGKINKAPQAKMFVAGSVFTPKIAQNGKQNMPQAGGIQSLLQKKLYREFSRSFLCKSKKFRLQCAFSMTPVSRRVEQIKSLIDLKLNKNTIGAH